MVKLDLNPCQDLRVRIHAVCKCVLYVCGVCSMGTREHVQVCLHTLEYACWSATHASTCLLQGSQEHIHSPLLSPPKASPQQDPRPVAHETCLLPPACKGKEARSALPAETHFLKEAGKETGTKVSFREFLHGWAVDLLGEETGSQTQLPFQ